ncbi:MAG: hypothetical protein ACFBWO_07615 [Paracoccaceae bacterium]
MLLALWPGPGAAEDGLTYRMDACSRDPEGMIHVRLYTGQEFAFPIEVPNKFFGDGSDPTGLPVDEAEPEGCPGHPVATPGLGFGWDPSLGDPSVGPLDPDWAVGAIGLHRMRESRHGPLSVQRMNFEFFHRHQHLEQITVLRPSDEVIGSYQNDWGSLGEQFGLTAADGRSTLIAAPGVYEEFEGLPLTAKCDATFQRGGSKLCRVGYALTCDLTVSYKFRTHRVAEGEMVALDRQIRAFLRRHVTNGAPLQPSDDCGDRSDGG